jgi:hypothetical protein
VNKPKTSDEERQSVAELKKWLAESAGLRNATALQLFKAVSKDATRGDVLLAWGTLVASRDDVDATLAELSYAL